MAANMKTGNGVKRIGENQSAIGGSGSRSWYPGLSAIISGINSNVCGGLHYRRIRDGENLVRGVMTLSAGGIVRPDCCRYFGRYRLQSPAGISRGYWPYLLGIRSWLQ